MAARAPGVVWQYEDDQPGSGNWRDCGVYLSGRLEFHLNDSTPFDCSINGVRYAFDFSSMTQTNTVTGFQRALRSWTHATRLLLLLLAHSLPATQSLATPRVLG